MKTEGKVRLAEVFVDLRDPRQAKKVEHDLVDSPCPGKTQGRPQGAPPHRRYF
jgi:hypothetical protein